MILIGYCLVEMGFLGESAPPASCLTDPIGAGTRSPPVVVGVVDQLDKGSRIGSRWDTIFRSRAWVALSLVEDCCISMAGTTVKVFNIRHFEDLTRSNST